jgi:ABC-type glycerol-3-phosphate transport system substrate-binding protein
VLDGWLWVLPAGDVGERALALRFVEWMNAPDRQAELARAVHQIPARGAAVDLWAEGDTGRLVEQILGGTLVPADWALRQPELARKLQDGLTQVLTGASTPEQAAATAAS